MTSGNGELRPGFVQRKLTLRTGGACEVHDITADVESVVSASAVAAGVALVHTLHTTAGLLLNESESGLRRDLATLAARLVPADDSYRHDDMSVRTENICPEDLAFPNGHAHLQHALFGTPTLTVTVTAGRLLLGRWQRILLVEYDRERDRSVSVAVFGLRSAGAPVTEHDDRYERAPR